MRLQATLVGMTGKFGKDPAKQYRNASILLPGNPDEGMQAISNLVGDEHYQAGKEPSKFPRPCTVDVDINLARGTSRLTGVFCE